MRVIWAEIKWFINNSKIPLTADKGGPLIVNDREIRKLVNGVKCPTSYIISMVASKDRIAAMQGHHVKNTGDGIPRTLFVSDESSSVIDEYFTMARTWANSMLIIGNTWPCVNYFYRAVEGDPASEDAGGDIPSTTKPGRFFRKIIHIEAEDSPNIRYARAQEAVGIVPNDKVIIPGVKSWGTYQKELITFDEIQKSVSHKARFYKGKELFLFPEEVLYAARRTAAQLVGRPRFAKSMGVDAAEGGDDTVWTVVDHFGIIKQVSMKTKDTADIPGQTIALMKEFKLNAEDVFFDRGGGGKEHADALRRKGHDVRTIGFGESASDPNATRRTATTRQPTKQRVELEESRYSFKNRRAEMYWILSQQLSSERGFGIPADCSETIRQLKPLPKKYDDNGRFYLPPKDKPSDNYKGVTIRQLIGRSPDQADSLALAVYGMLRRPVKVIAGALR